MAEILVTDITTTEINGDGTFDVLMQTVDRHLLEEFSKNRIRGIDYATVYTSSLNSVLQQSIGFLLGRQQADKQADLIDAQIRGIEADIIKTDQEILLVQAQIKKIDAEIDLVEQQIIISKLEAENIEFEGLKIQAETRLIDQNTVNATAQFDVLVQQRAKIEMETALLEEKRFSEQAQRLDVVDGDPVTGMLGVQKNLYNKQAEGFLRNAEQKIAKIYTDSFNVRLGVNDQTEPGGAGLGDSEIQQVLAIAKAGISRAET